MDREPACARHPARPAGGGRSTPVAARSRNLRFSSQSFPRGGRGGGSEESRLLAGLRLHQAEMLVGKLGRDSPAGCPCEEAELHQEGLVDVLDRLRIL